MMNLSEVFTVDPGKARQLCHLIVRLAEEPDGAKRKVVALLALKSLGEFTQEYSDTFANIAKVLQSME